MTPRRRILVGAAALAMLVLSIIGISGYHSSANLKKCEISLFASIDRPEGPVTISARAGGQPVDPSPYITVTLRKESGIYEGELTLSRELTNVEGSISDVRTEPVAGEDGDLSYTANQRTISDHLEVGPYATFGFGWSYFEGMAGEQAIIFAELSTCPPPQPEIHPILVYAS